MKQKPAKSKKLAGDFEKKRFKLGRKHVSSHVANVRSKAVKVLPQRAILTCPLRGSKRRQLTGLLDQMKGQSALSRLSAVNALREILDADKSDVQQLLHEDLSTVFERLLSLLADDTPRLRETVLAILVRILESITAPQAGTVRKIVSVHVWCLLTHVKKTTRMVAVRVISSALDSPHGKLLFSASDSILETKQSQRVIDQKWISQVSRLVVDEIQVGADINEDYLGSVVDVLSQLLGCPEAKIEREIAIQEEAQSSPAPSSQTVSEPDEKNNRSKKRTFDSVYFGEYTPEKQYTVPAFAQSSQPWKPFPAIEEKDSGEDNGVIALEAALLVWSYSSFAPRPMKKMECLRWKTSAVSVMVAIQQNGSSLFKNSGIQPLHRMVREVVAEYPIRATNMGDDSRASRAAIEKLNLLLTSLILTMVHCNILCPDTPEKFVLNNPWLTEIVFAVHRSQQFLEDELIAMCSSISSIPDMESGTSQERAQVAMTADNWMRMTLLLDACSLLGDFDPSYLKASQTSQTKTPPTKSTVMTLAEASVVMQWTAANNDQSKWESFFLSVCQRLKVDKEELLEEDVHETADGSHLLLIWIRSRMSEAVLGIISALLHPIAVIAGAAGSMRSPGASISQTSSDTRPSSPAETAITSDAVAMQSYSVDDMHGSIETATASSPVTLLPVYSALVPSLEADVSMSASLSSGMPLRDDRNVLVACESAVVEQAVESSMSFAEREPVVLEGSTMEVEECMNGSEVIPLDAETHSDCSSSDSLIGRREPTMAEEDDPSRPAETMCEVADRMTSEASVEVVDREGAILLFSLAIPLLAVLLQLPLDPIAERMPTAATRVFFARVVALTKSFYSADGTLRPTIVQTVEGFLHEWVESCDNAATVLAQTSPPHPLAACASRLCIEINRSIWVQRHLLA